MLRPVSPDLGTQCEFPFLSAALPTSLAGSAPCRGQHYSWSVTRQSQGCDTHVQGGSRQPQDCWVFPGEGLTPAPSAEKPPLTAVVAVLVVRAQKCCLEEVQGQGAQLGPALPPVLRRTPALRPGKTLLGPAPLEPRS